MVLFKFEMENRISSIKTDNRKCISCIIRSHLKEHIGECILIVIIFILNENKM